MEDIHIYFSIETTPKIKKRIKICRDVMCNLLKNLYFVNNELSNRPIQHNYINSTPTNKDFLHQTKYTFATSPKDGFNLSDDDSSIVSTEVDQLSESDYINKAEDYGGIHITLAEYKHVQPNIIKSFIKELKERMKYQRPFILFFDNDIYLYRNKSKDKFYTALHVLNDMRARFLRSIFRKLRQLEEEFELVDLFCKRSVHASAVYTMENLEPLLKKHKFNVDKKNKWAAINKFVDEDINKALQEDQENVFAYINCFFIKTGRHVVCIPFKGVTE